MQLHPWRISTSAAALLAAVLLAACDSKPKRVNPVTTDLQTRISTAIHPALRGTVGDYATLVDGGPIKVEGYGIVAELPNTGSGGDMDTRVRELLLNRTGDEYLVAP